MNKPFSMIYRETKQALVDTINNSGLPIDVIGSILGELIAEVRSQSDRAYMNDVQSYNASLEQELQTVDVVDSEYSEESEE